MGGPWEDLLEEMAFLLTSSLLGAPCMPRPMESGAASIPNELTNAPDSGVQDGKGGHISSPPMAKSSWQLRLPGKGQCLEWD